MKKILFLVLCILQIGFVSPVMVEAQSFESHEKELFPTWDGSGAGSREGVGDTNITGVLGALNEDEHKSTGLFELIPRITQILLQVVAPIAFLTVVWAGFRFVFYRDDEEQMEKSKKFFTNALLGLVIIIFSYSILKIVYFLFSA